MTAHCLPTGYKKHAESAERIHALEKELDALKHVAEPRMERRGTCQEECEDAFEKPKLFFPKWLEARYGECPDCWDNMDKTKTGDRSKIRQFDTYFFHYSGCERFCKLVDPE